MRNPCLIAFIGLTACCLLCLLSSIPTVSDADGTLSDNDTIMGYQSLPHSHDFQSSNNSHNPYLLHHSNNQNSNDNSNRPSPGNLNSPPNSPPPLDRMMVNTVHLHMLVSIDRKTERFVDYSS